MRSEELIWTEGQKRRAPDQVEVVEREHQSEGDLVNPKEAEAVGRLEWQS